MAKYIRPETEVIEFKTVDVVTTSGETECGAVGAVCDTCGGDVCMGDGPSVCGNLTWGGGFD